MFGYDLESFPYSNISSIEMSKELMGHVISFFSSNNKVSMKWINDQNARQKDIAGFVEFVRTNIGKSTNHTSQNIESIPDQILKLSDLKDKGVLTEEEFSDKKKELLAKL